MPLPRFAAATRGSQEDPGNRGLSFCFQSIVMQCLSVCVVSSFKKEEEEEKKTLLFYTSLPRGNEQLFMMENKLPHKSIPCVLGWVQGLFSRCAHCRENTGKAAGLSEEGVGACLPHPWRREGPANTRAAGRGLCTPEHCSAFKFSFQELSLSHTHLDIILCYIIHVLPLAFLCGTLYKMTNEQRIQYSQSY